MSTKISSKQTLMIISWGFVILAIICAVFGVKYHITKDFNSIVVTHKLLNLVLEIIFLVLHVTFKALSEIADEYGPFKDRN